MLPQPTLSEGAGRAAAWDYVSGGQRPARRGSADYPFAVHPSACPDPESCASAEVAAIQGRRASRSKAGRGGRGAAGLAEERRARYAPDTRPGAARGSDQAARGAALTGAQIVSTVPKDIAVAPAIRLLQRWGWDLLAERLAGRVRYYPQHQRQFAALAGRWSLCASSNGRRHWRKLKRSAIIR